MNYRLRQQNLVQALNAKKLEALIVTHPANIGYLCGFSGSAGVLVAQPPRWTFYTDGRYTEQARQQVFGARVILAKGSLLAAAMTALAKKAPRTLGVEAEHLTVGALRSVTGLLPKRSRLDETQGLVECLRMVKEPEEIERLRAAAAMGTGCLAPAIQAIAPGIPETAVAAEIEYAARRAGAEGMSFETIVAAGPRSALPHGLACTQPIPRKGFVVMDFGVILSAYCSDMTRTVHVGRPSTGDAFRL